jgi:hypothetical protein
MPIYWASLWSLPARSEDHSGGRKTLYSFAVIFTAKCAKKLRKARKALLKGILLYILPRL